jgi:hypothetical protein
MTLHAKSLDISCQSLLSRYMVQSDIQTSAEVLYRPSVWGEQIQNIIGCTSPAFAQYTEQHGGSIQLHDNVIDMLTARNASIIADRVARVTYTRRSLRHSWLLTTAGGASPNDGRWNRDFVAQRQLKCADDVLLLRPRTSASAAP